LRGTEENKLYLDDFFGNKKFILKFQKMTKEKKKVSACDDVKSYVEVNDNHLFLKYYK